jgi:hypothetical protein
LVPILEILQLGLSVQHHPLCEEIIVAKGNNAQGKDKKKAKTGPKKNAKAAASKLATPPKR